MEWWPRASAFARRQLVAQQIDGTSAIDLLLTAVNGHSGDYQSNGSQHLEHFSFAIQRRTSGAGLPPHPGPKTLSAHQAAAKSGAESHHQKLPKADEAACDAWR